MSKTLALSSVVSSVAVLLGPAPALALDPGLHLLSDFTYAERIVKPMTPVSARGFVSADLNAEITSSWAARLGAQAWTEGLQQPDFHADSKSSDRSDLRLQDVFLEGASDHFILRLGNQQVVWGETFGHFVADLVNPRDLRYGSSLNLARTRLSTPMANLKFINGGFFLQAIAMPVAQFDLLPQPGSDYSPDISSKTGFNDIYIEREHDLPVTAESSSGGVRMGQTIGSMDLSVFYLNRFDHLPAYDTLPATTATQLYLREHHGRAVSEGFTVAAELEGWVLRGEVVSTNHQFLPVVANSTLLSEQATELSHTESLDFPTFAGINLALQWEESSLPPDRQYLFRYLPKTQYASLHLMTDLFAGTKFEALASYSPADKGYRLFGEVAYQISSQWEFRLGAEDFTGPYASDLGQISRASRGYALLRFFYNDNNFLKPPQPRRLYEDSNPAPSAPRKGKKRAKPKEETESPILNFHDYKEE